MNTPTYTAPTPAAPEPTTLYRVIDTRTGDPIGHTYTTRTRARKAADRLDLRYGAIRYVVRAVETSCPCGCGSEQPHQEY